MCLQTSRWWTWPVTTMTMSTSQRTTKKWWNIWTTQRNLTTQKSSLASACPRAHRFTTTLKYRRHILAGENIRRRGKFTKKIKMSKNYIVNEGKELVDDSFFLSLVTAHVTIYFNDDHFIESKRSELYGWVNFLSNCGGQLISISFKFLWIILGISRRHRSSHGRIAVIARWNFLSFRLEELFRKPQEEIRSRSCAIEEETCWIQIAKLKSFIHGFYC